MGIRNKKVMRTRTLFCGLSLMMATLGFVACTEEHVENIINEDNNSGDTNTGDETKLIPMTFTAVGSNCSRTELQSDNSVYWSPGDCIGVFTSSNNRYKFVTDITEKSATATFHGEIEESDSYIAFYPYPKLDDGSLSIKDNVLSFKIPENQNAVNGSFDNSLNPSLAIVKEGNNLIFKNLCALMKFKFTGSEETMNEIKKISIRDNNKVPLSDMVDYDLEYEVSNYRYVNGGFPVSIVSDKFENNGTYYFVLPAFSDAFNSGFTISFYNENDVEIFRKSTKSNIPLTAGKILNMGTIEVQKDVDYEIAEDGTYLVYKASGLKAWADHVNADNWSTNVTLMSDITFGENEYWSPVGNTSNVFKGIFDGNGKTIKGLKIGRSDSKDIRNALFGRMGGNAVIKDLTVESPVCYGGTYVSVLACTCEDNSQIINCHVNDAKIECIFGGTSGIICGSLQGGYIEGCTATGTVTGKGVTIVGGFIGEIKLNSSVVCSGFEGTVTGNSEKYGGFAGYLYGKIIGCYAVASVTGSNNTGGLVGYVLGSNNSLSASYFKGSVKCSNTYAGLIAGNVTKSSFGMDDAYYYQDGGDVTVAAGNKIEFAGFKAVSNWNDAIIDMNSKIGDTYKYEYVWDDTKQHPVLQATE